LAKVFPIILFFILSFGINFSYSQDAEKNTVQKLQEAQQLIEQQKYDDAIKILQEAKKEDTTNYKIVYELGLAYYYKKNLPYTILVFNHLIKMKNINADCYETFGKILDANHQSERALDMYYQGLKKFPQSGSLYYQIGNYYLGQKKYNEAVVAYENGIAAEPTFAMNYYHAAKLFCYSNEEVWGMIYGEIFLNLSKNSSYAKEISKLLYNTYVSEIKLTSDSTIAVSFSMEKSTPDALAYGTTVYEPLLEAALKGTKLIDMNALNKMRSKFLDIYFEKKYDKKYQNVLFDYQYKIKSAGYFEAYNYWLLGNGNTTVFEIWKAKNKNKWLNFYEWFKANSIELNSNNYFLRKNFLK